MINDLNELFSDPQIIRKIQKKLPMLFQIAEIESSRAERIGMEVGSVREKIIIALLICSFGERNVQTEIPITEPEVDVKVKNNPISIKTISGKSPAGIKLNWTVDADKAVEFKNHYHPSCDMLLVHIYWENIGGFYYIPLKAQQYVFKDIGIENYINLPKQGTNPRGINFSRKTIQLLMTHSLTKLIPITWKKKQLIISPYRRWIELWNQD